MPDFAILNTRKRLLIALIHSVVFWGIAVHGFSDSKSGLMASFTRGDALRAGIYFTVAAVLLWLVSISSCVRERLYFALCAGSATLGLLRVTLGDAALPAAQYLRVGLLTTAVLLGAGLLRAASTSRTQSAVTE